MKEMVSVFYLNVDGKRYGPFFSQTDEKVKRLMHLKGVTVDHVMIEAPDVDVEIVKKKRIIQPSLLDGIGWFPVRKG